MSPRAHWHLRYYLSGLLVLASVIAFLFGLGLLIALKLPQFAADTRADLAAKSRDLAQRTETILTLQQNQLELLAATQSRVRPADFRHLLDIATNESGFSAIYALEESGRVTWAAIVNRDGTLKRNDLVGSDLSNDRLRKSVAASGKPALSDKYLSPTANAITVAIGVPTGKGVLIGELQLNFFLRAITENVGTREQTIWVADRFGEILADNERPERVGVVNLASLPVVAAAAANAVATGRIDFEGRSYEAAAARSGLLQWYFVARTPAGLGMPRIHSALELAFAALGALMVLSLSLAPIWATQMARPIGDIAERARQVADGRADVRWPRGRIVELNQLSADLERMSQSILQRGQELEAIFQFSPVGMLVADVAQNHAFVRANDAVVKLLGYPRDELLGGNGRSLKLWQDPSQRDRLLADLATRDVPPIEAWLVRKDQSTFLAQIVARKVTLGARPYLIWVAEDITEVRRIASEIRTLNADLEQRVAQRTEELHRANATLSTTIAHLQITQDELVRSEKLASLGALVAGIAHELNTPLGNGVMAVSTLCGALKSFRQESAAGLRRSSLDHLLETMDTGTDIALRNLTRAAELVNGFKQVAADQSSSQRRRFDLDAVMREIVLTLRPLLRRSGVSVSVEVADGLRLDSYPGPLGQVLTNLISNAVTHAFDGRNDGRMRLVARADDGERVVIQVIDNGCGIPARLLPRIFDPFVTTRMGRGGTGLGLHIVHNLVTQALGGSIRVDSQEDVGTTFTVALPRVAPRRAADA